MIKDVEEFAVQLQAHALFFTISPFFCFQEPPIKSEILVHYSKAIIVQTTLFPPHPRKRSKGNIEEAHAWAYIRISSSEKTEEALNALLGYGELWVSLASDQFVCLYLQDFQFSMEGFSLSTLLFFFFFSSFVFVLALLGVLS